MSVRTKETVVSPKFALVAFKESLSTTILPVSELTGPRCKVTGATVKLTVEGKLQKATIVTISEKKDFLLKESETFNAWKFFGLSSKRLVTPKNHTEAGTLIPTNQARKPVASTPAHKSRSRPCYYENLPSPIVDPTDPYNFPDSPVSHDAYKSSRSLFREMAKEIRPVHHIAQEIMTSTKGQSPNSNKEPVMVDSVGDATGFNKENSPAMTTQENPTVDNTNEHEDSAQHCPTNSLAPDLPSLIDSMDVELHQPLQSNYPTSSNQDNTASRIGPLPDIIQDIETPTTTTYAKDEELLNHLEMIRPLPTSTVESLLHEEQDDFMSTCEDSNIQFVDQMNHIDITSTNPSSIPPTETIATPSTISTHQPDVPTIYRKGQENYLRYQGVDLMCLYPIDLYYLMTMNQQRADNYKLSNQYITDIVLDKSTRPEQFSRNLVYGMFTLSELYNTNVYGRGFTDGIRNGRLDDDKVRKIRKLTFNFFTDVRFSWRNCVIVMNKSIKYIFNSVLPSLKATLDQQHKKPNIAMEISLIANPHSDPTTPLLSTCAGSKKLSYPKDPNASIESSELEDDSLPEITDISLTYDDILQLPELHVTFDKMTLDENETSHQKESSIEGMVEVLIPATFDNLYTVYLNNLDYSLEFSSSTIGNSILSILTSSLSPNTTSLHDSPCNTTDIFEKSNECAVSQPRTPAKNQRYLPYSRLLSPRKIFKQSTLKKGESFNQSPTHSKVNFLGSSNENILQLTPVELLSALHKGRRHPRLNAAMLSDQDVCDAILTTSARPEMFARNLLFRMFTLSELYNSNVYGRGFTDGIRNGRLDADKVRKIRQLTFDLFSDVNFSWRNCVLVMNKSIRYIFTRILV